MSRVDVPTLRCDRCKVETQDLTEMARFQQIIRYHMSGHDEWDLCPLCWADFRVFVAPLPGGGGDLRERPPADIFGPSSAGVPGTSWVAT